jgi:GDP-L-fucose synthase
MTLALPILITGSSGFLGHHVTETLRHQYGDNIVTPGRKDYDLTEAQQVIKLYKDIRPGTVLHLAAKVGGIIANKAYPADFYYKNIMMNSLMLHHAQRQGVTKFMTFMGGCSYPAKAISPISEDQMWDGYPQTESAAYSSAKKMMLVQSLAYRQQYDFNSIVLIPGNVYGEHDNFNEEYSHVIPAMIRRFIDARETRAPSITCYGSGRPTRDFVYAPDVAKLIPWFIEHYDSSEPVNISSGTRTSIKALAELVADLTGYTGTIIWDTSKPDGQMDKIFSVERLHDLGLTCDTPLKEGLKKTIQWYEQARLSGNARL